MRFKILFLAIFCVVLISGCKVNFEPKNQNFKDDLEVKEENLCKDKSPKDCNDMGVLFELKKDFTRAEICYKIACEASLGVACSNLGSLYQSQNKNDNSLIISLFLKACELGNVYGCYNGGNFYRISAKEHKDFVRAIRLYEKACIKLNYSKACTNLGGMHQFSLGVEGGSRDTARKYYKMGCELGDEVGCKNLSLFE